MSGILDKYSMLTHIRSYIYEAILDDITVEDTQKDSSQ